MSAITRRTRAGAAAAAVPTPGQVSGLVGWWRASTLALADGDPISSFTDGSGSGNHLTASGTARPTFKTNIVNGLAVARFDGVNDAMSVATFNPGATAALTVFAVLSATSGGDRIVAELSDNATSNTGAFAFVRATSNIVTTFCRRTGINSCNSTRTVTTTPRVVVATFDMALASGEAVNWVDGNQGAQSTNSNNSGNFGTTFPLRVGARGASSLWLAGDIAELGIYNRALTAAELTLLQLHLGARYRISIG